MNTFETKYAKAVQRLIWFESGLAVSEMPQARLNVLHEKSFAEYEARLNSFDPLDVISWWTNSNIQSNVLNLVGRRYGMFF